ncbi:MAG: hypothetical protein DWQ34_24190 [Planctomycetota bacterium]|nr:MAG: hypothetical protein DWQ29_12885 [Planctomycetota bacterium]REJ87749.1 MAG: hypothetical protein DWQ34_24190 [Planctomycetota bacterium]REK27832.1 MAG: hypothetical protein DWQ41_06940 [Planctomycetota bacterium]REK40286.1 MAG: hypothetical protein DWQ45_00180 [Planctomycetota bacterium]
MVESHQTAVKTKCPACGGSVPAGKYRCLKCGIYFCSKCRIRLAKRDRQCQCVNQQCDDYGKLICYNCTVKVAEEKLIPVKIGDSLEIALLTPLYISPIVGLVAGKMSEFGIGVLATLASYPVLAVLIFTGCLMARKKSYTVVRNCCADCRQPVQQK